MDTLANRYIKIQYLIHISNNEGRGESWPNSYDIRDIKSIGIYSIISKLQKNVGEVLFNKEKIILDRMSGVLCGYLIKFIENADELEEVPYFFKVVFTDDTTLKVDKITNGTIYIFTGALNDCPLEYVHYTQINPLVLKGKIMGCIKELNGSAREILDQLKAWGGYESSYSTIKTDIRVPVSLYSNPNLGVLESIRCPIDTYTEEVDEYNEEELIKLVNLINKIKINLQENIGLHSNSSLNNYYITDDSSSLEFCNNRKAYKEAALVDNNVTNAKELIEGIKVSDRGGIIEKNTKNPYLVQLKQERLLFNSLIALAAGNEVAAVIKVPLSNNQVYYHISSLGSADRTSSRKISAMMKKLKEAFSESLGPWFEYLDNCKETPIKLVSNLPLEWAFHQGMPLMIRHNVSRIPVTPGDLTKHLLLDSQNINLTLSDFEEILCISSFSDDDPIRNDLKNSFEILQQKNFDSETMIADLKDKKLISDDFAVTDQKALSKIKIKWVNVSNKKELIKAINDYTGAITVFDLHGGHDENGGLISLKDETVSVFDIYTDIQISPIIILSACDTSPIDKGHSSTAEAFFRAGAKALIASTLPIQSRLASTFLARLLLRLQYLLPIEIESRGGFVRWSTVVSGMLRRTYYYELILLLQKKLKFTPEQKNELMFKIGMCIDPLRPDWVEATRKIIIDTLGINREYLDKFIEENALFLECMKYIQMGRPENILISDVRMNGSST